MKLTRLIKIFFHSIILNFERNIHSLHHLSQSMISYIKVNINKKSFSLQESITWKPIGGACNFAHIGKELFKTYFFVTICVERIKNFLAFCLRQCSVYSSQQVYELIKLQKSNAFLVRLSKNVVQIKNLLLLHVLNESFKNVCKFFLCFLLISKLSVDVGVFKKLLSQSSVGSLQWDLELLHCFFKLTHLQ